MRGGGFSNSLLFLQLLVLLYIYIYILTIICFQLFVYFFVQTSTNVLVGCTNAALMHFATTLKVHTIAYANMDSREMEGNVKVGVRFLSDYVIKNKAYVCDSSTKGW